MTRRIILNVVTTAALFGLSHLAVANKADAILGVWLTAEGGSKVEIYPCADKYCGKVIWLKEPAYPHDDKEGMAGQMKVDRKNPDPARRTDPVVGKEILKNLTYADNGIWEDGEIYDPKSGNTYRCKATLDTAGGRLDIRGYIGISLIGRTSVWTR